MTGGEMKTLILVEHKKEEPKPTIAYSILEYITGIPLNLFEA